MDQGSWGAKKSGGAGGGTAANSQSLSIFCQPLEAQERVQCCLHRDPGHSRGAEGLVVPSSPVPGDRLWSRVLPLAACFVLLMRTATGLEAIEKWLQRSPGPKPLLPRLCSPLPQLAGDRDRRAAAGVARCLGMGRAALCKKSLWVGTPLSWLETMFWGWCCKHKSPEAAGTREPFQPAVFSCGWGAAGACPPLLWGWHRDASAGGCGATGGLPLTSRGCTQSGRWGSATPAPGRRFLTMDRSWFLHPPLSGQSPWSSTGSMGGIEHFSRVGPLGGESLLLCRTRGMLLCRGLTRAQQTCCHLR